MIPAQGHSGQSLSQRYSGHRQDPLWAGPPSISETLTPTVTHTGTAETHQFTSCAHLWAVGGNQRTQRKPRQTQREHENSTQTVAWAGNDFFFSSIYNETLFEDLLCMYIWPNKIPAPACCPYLLPLSTDCKQILRANGIIPSVFSSCHYRGLFYKKVPPSCLLHTHVNQVHPSLLSGPHYRPFSKPSSQSLCYPTSVHGYVFLPSHHVILAKNDFPALLCHLSNSPLVSSSCLHDQPVHKHTGLLSLSGTCS